MSFPAGSSIVPRETSRWKPAPTARGTRCSGKALSRVYCLFFMCAWSKEASCNRGEEQGAPLCRHSPCHIRQCLCQVRAGGGFSTSSSSPSGSLMSFPYSSGHTGPCPLLGCPHAADSGLLGWVMPRHPPSPPLRHPHREANSTTLLSHTRFVLPCRSVTPRVCVLT